MLSNTTTDIKGIHAQRIADGLYKEDTEEKLNTGLRRLMDVFINLNDSAVHVTFEPFFHCRGLIVEMACLLSNPDISEKLQEHYFKENAGKILKGLFHFFDSLMTEDDIHKYLTWYNLKHFWGNASEEDLEYIEKAFKD